MQILSCYPTEIESDLSLYHDFDIADWWRGEKSSRWVWTRIIHLPDESQFKAALREGDWSIDRYLLAHVANELKYHRADFARAHGGDMNPQPILSPGQQQEKDAEDQDYRDAREILLGQMRGDYTPPTREVGFIAETGKPREVTRG